MARRFKRDNDPARLAEEIRQEVRQRRLDNPDCQPTLMSWMIMTQFGWTYKDLINRVYNKTQDHVTDFTSLIF